jgi:hypothetical protein
MLIGAGMAAHATKLALRTPEDEHAWSPLIGTAVLLENKYLNPLVPT